MMDRNAAWLRVLLVLFVGILTCIPAQHAHAQWLFGEDQFATRPWMALRRSFGDDVGYEHGFSRLETFVPLLESPNDWILFFDGRAVNFDNRQAWQVNVGGGLRVYLADIDAVFGLNGYYDGRTTDVHYYNQAGAGWELLGGHWEARGNVYIPTGPQQYQAGDSGLFDLRFLGHYIEGDRIRTYETTMGGTDVEIGCRLPVLEELNPRAYLGFYHFSAHEMRTANGIRGRVETYLTDNITAQGAVQHDDLFKTTVTGGIAIYFGRYGGASRNTRAINKMGYRVVREPAVVIARHNKQSSELLIDPRDGEPVRVTHVASFATPGGDGTVENPFQTLLGAETGSLPEDIVFAHAVSDFYGEGITLQDGQRLLGEGIPHFVSAVQGDFLLPRATSNSALPIIQYSPSNAVSLANNTEVSGLDLRNSWDDGIDGDDIVNVNINRNMIRDAGDDGIDLDDVGGTVHIVGNRIYDSDEYGMELLNGGNVMGTYNIANNIIEGSGASGIFALAEFNSHYMLNLTGNHISDSLEDGVTLVGIEEGRLDVVMTGNTIGTAAYSSVYADLYDHAVLNLQLVGNTFRDWDGDGSDAAGLEIEAGNDATAFVQVVGNTFNATGLTGPAIGMVTFNRGEICAQVAHNTTNQDFFFLRLDSPTDTFNLEDTLGTNTFQGGSMANLHPDVMIVPEGFCGFPNW